jgi:ATP-dependent DNA helicase RecQ
MLDYAQEPRCLTGRLLEYFGENIEPCGHCSVCEGQAPAALPPRARAGMDACDVSGFDALAQAHPNALGRPRQQARFLCGLNSPAVSAVRGLRGNPLFARCAEVPFAEVLAARR